MYVEHIAKRAGAHKPVGQYLPDAINLFHSMKENGFDSSHPVPVNKNFGLLGGAHRTSLAIVLKQKLPVEQFDTDQEWPAWDREWFEKHGMARELPWMEKIYNILKVEPSVRQSTQRKDNSEHKGARAEGSPYSGELENA